MCIQLGPFDRRQAKIAACFCAPKLANRSRDKATDVLHRARDGDKLPVGVPADFLDVGVRPHDYQETSDVIKRGEVRLDARLHFLAAFTGREDAGVEGRDESHLDAEVASPLHSAFFYQKWSW